jgi:hypothetical protein
MSTPTPHGPPSAGSGPVGPGQRLVAEAASAAEVRAHQVDPDVVALRVEQTRTQVVRLMWAGIGLGLCFTMTNVAQFAAAGAAVGSLGWLAAWLLDPAVSLVLLAVLRAEQVTARWQVSTGVWPRVAKWVLLAATYVMNTWSSWAAGSVPGVVLHSVPPLVVVIAAEAVTDLHYALTECVQRAHTATQHTAQQAQRARVARAEQAQPAEVNTSAVNTSTPGHPALAGTPGEHPLSGAGGHLVGGFTGHTGERAGEHPVNPPAAVARRVAHRAPRPTDEPHRAGRSRGAVRRKLLADYLAEARAAWAPGVVVTPAWVRQVTDCSRGLSSKVAAALSADLTSARHTGGTLTSQTDPQRRAA